MRKAFSFITSVLMSVVLSGCSTHSVEPPPDVPIVEPQFIPKTNPTRAQGWQGVSQADIRNRLSSQTSLTATYQEDNAGHLSYFGADVSGKRGRYVVVTDYEKFESTDAIQQRIGVAIRVTASIETLEAKVGISDLWVVAAEVSKGRAKGELKVEAFGLPNIGTLPAPFLTIDRTAVANALTEQNKLIAKLANTDTLFDPYELTTPPSPKLLSVGAQAATATDPMDAGSFSYSLKPGNTYPSATASEEKDTILYHATQHFNKRFGNVPVVVTSVTGQMLKGRERFEVHPVKITQEGFDIELQVWRGTVPPDVVTVSWIAFDKERLSGLESRLLRNGGGPMVLSGEGVSGDVIRPPSGTTDDWAIIVVPSNSGSAVPNLPLQHTRLGWPDLPDKSGWKVIAQSQSAGRDAEGHTFYYLMIHH